MKWHYLPLVTAASLAASMALAADVAKKKGPAEPPPPPAWLDTLTVDGYVEGGVAINFNQPFNKFNWGHVYTDRANWPQFNGAVLTVQRPIDSASPNYDFGFKLQGQIGTDARYNHYLGLLNYAVKDRTQIALIEAHALAHLPWNTFLSEGGIDVKVGKFATYNGAEVIYAPDNLFYSHSYIFNFGPFFHTGVMVTTHVRDWLDIYTGVTTGTNTGIGWAGDNNAAAAVYGGFGLNLLNGDLTVVGVVHHGPENPKQLDPLGVGWPNTPLACVCNPNTANRTFSNLTTTWKVTENFTLVTDIAYNRESGGNPIEVTGLPVGTIDALTGVPFSASGIFLKPQGADAYAVAQYASYKVNDLLKVNGRIEYYRDNKNFFVVGFPGYFDAMNGLHGWFCPSCLAQPGGVGTSYLSLTAGVTITPELPKLPVITGMIIRPEFRWDTAVNGATPFFRGGGNGLSRSQGMFNVDVIIPFSLL